MIEQREINQTANKLEIRDTQIEKDYVIGWVLKGISNNKYLKEKLIFKGGTALRKIYFSDYRLSEDLDFTYNGNNFNQEEIKKCFEELNEWVYNESRIKLNIKDEVLHKTGNYTFNLGYNGPLGGAGANKSIKVDIANDETLCNTPVDMNVTNEYSDLQEDFSVKCYPLDEIISEKMRSLMQRTAPRDLYDLWYLFEIERYNIEDFIYDFQMKAKFKGLEPNNLLSTVRAKEDTYKAMWENHLVNQIKDVPEFDEVWRELGKYLKKFEKVIKK